MKERKMISIALLMILCLALTGCGQSKKNAASSQTAQSSSEPAVLTVKNYATSETDDDHNESPDEPEMSSSDISQEIPADEPEDESDDGIGTNENPKKNEDGWYLYDVDSRQIALKTNIWDYISTVDGKKVFDALKMAEDLGWEWADKDRTDFDTSAISPEWKTRFRLESYSGDFSRKQKHVEFCSGAEHVTQISNSFNVIDFDRLDVENGDLSKAFYLNGTDDYAASTVSIEEIIIGCYEFERTTEDSTEEPLIQGGIYGYRPIVIHK